MEQSPRRRAHTKVGPRRVGVPALHPAKSPPRRRRSQIRPKNLLLLFIIEKYPPPGRRAHQALQKAPPKATTNQAHKKEPLPTPERLFLLFWFIPATHSPGGAASRTRRPHPRPCGRRWGKFRSWDFSSGRTPSPCPYQSQSTAAHPPC